LILDKVDQDDNSIFVNEHQNDIIEDELQYNISTFSSHFQYVYDWYRKPNSNDPKHDANVILNAPLPGTNDPKAPPLDNEYLKKYWLLHGLQPTPSQHIVKRSRLLDSVKWNGDDRTFSRYEDNIVAWALQIGMGYLV
jgi:hypothetical protein